VSAAQPAAYLGSTRAVAEGTQFDEARLTRYLEARVSGFRGPLVVEQFEGGQSNPTYLLITPDHRYVLRRKPAGVLLKSAHAVDREYRVTRPCSRPGCRSPSPWSCARTRRSSAASST
jgi:aminoglycoside phosphotransferase (APT) family kinase protein